MSIYREVKRIEEVVTATSLAGQDVNLIKVDGTAVSVEDGNITAGTQRVCIADNDTNLTAIKADLDELYACIDHVNKHVEVDTNAINGVITSVNVGTLDDGVQRVCIADNDTNIQSMQIIQQNLIDRYSNSQVNQYSGVALQTLNGVDIEHNAGVLSDGVMRVCIADDDTNLGKLGACIDTGNNRVEVDVNAVGGTEIAVNSGILGGGVQRVCIADDDTNLLQLVTILTDVWDSTAHALRTV